MHTHIYTLAYANSFQGCSHLITLYTVVNQFASKPGTVMRCAKTIAKQHMPYIVNSLIADYRPSYFSQPCCAR